MEEVLSALYKGTFTAQEATRKVRFNSVSGEAVALK